MPRRSRLAIVIGASLAVFALAALATTAGSLRPFTERPRSPGTRVLETPVTQPPLEELDQPERDSSDASLMLELLVRLFVLVVLAVVGFMIVRALIALLTSGDARRRRRLAPDEGELAVPTGAVELAEAAEDALRVLSSMAVDDAIIACWLRLEDAAADVGVARRPAETASDLAMRVLAAHDVSERPLRRLLSLYREARYSRHHMSELARDEARRALTVVHADLLTSGRPAPSGHPT